MDTARVMVVTPPAELAAFDRDARVERACELIVDAGRARAGWIIFPEAYLPGAPAWLWSGPPDDALAHELHAMAHAYAVVIPSAVSDRLCRVAQRSQVAVAIGMIERDNNTCYNSLLMIDAHGRICGHYRATLGSTLAQQGWNPVAGTIATQMRLAEHRWAGGI